LKKSSFQSDTRVEHNKLSTKKGTTMKTIAHFSLLLLLVVAIFDQANSQAITGLQIMNW
jgi:hypothetical protein